MQMWYSNDLNDGCQTASTARGIPQPHCIVITSLQRGKASWEMGGWREPVFKGVKIQFDLGAYAFSSWTYF